MACILLWSSAVRVHNSQAQKKMDVTKERISRILELEEILLSLQTCFNLVNAAVLCAILESISDYGIAIKCLKAFVTSACAQAICRVAGYE